MYFSSLSSHHTSYNLLHSSTQSTDLIIGSLVTLNFHSRRISCFAYLVSQRSVLMMTSSLFTSAVKLRTALQI